MKKIYWIAEIFPPSCKSLCFSVASTAELFKQRSQEKKNSNTFYIKKVLLSKTNFDPSPLPSSCECQDSEHRIWLVWGFA